MMSKNEKKSNCVWIDIIDIREKQFWFTVLVVIICISISEELGIYETILELQEELKNWLLELVGGFIGLLGFTLSGIAIITALFSKENMLMLQKGQMITLFDKIIKRFYFLTVVIGITLLIINCFYFCLSSNMPLVSKRNFFIFQFFLLYFIVFSVTYTISTVKQIIGLYRIKNKLDKIEKYERSIIDDANEVRIDYLFRLLLDNTELEEGELLGTLIKFIEESNDENKTQIMEYLYQHYK